MSIEYTKQGNQGSVEYRLDGQTVASVDNVGIPLDKQGVPYSGTYPSLGNGETLGGQIKSFAIVDGQADPAKVSAAVRREPAAVISRVTG